MIGVHTFFKVYFDSLLLKNKNISSGSFSKKTKEPQLLCPMCAAFNKLLFFPWTFRKYKDRFIALSYYQQKAVIFCLESGLTTSEAFDCIRKAEKHSNDNVAMFEQFVIDYLWEDFSSKAW